MRKRVFLSANKDFGQSAALRIRDFGLIDTCQNLPERLDL